jgi:glycosyltransferase involved in cell wall biosynthesis
VPELARENVSGAPLHLVVHYLPSLVTFGAAMTPSMLTGEERRALERVHDNLVTSEHMKRVLVGLGVPESRLYVIEPGVSVGANATRTLERRGGGFRALLVANLAPSKGVYDLLVSLGRALQSNVAFRLAVAGSFEMHAGYADLCRTLAEQHPALAGKVIFVGSIAHDEVIRYMTESDVLVSASRMESYGMALAEARAVGLPIVAVRGGNVESHVEARAGGALLADTDALAVELLRLATDPEELGRRRTLASATRRVRSWDDAAAEFRDRVRGERRIERDRDRRTRRGGA